MRILSAYCLVGLAGLVLAGCEETPDREDYVRRTTAPGVEVAEKRNGGVRVKAPLVDVETGGYKGSPEGTRVKAPFTRVETDGRGGERVEAPFTEVDTRAAQPPKPTPAAPPSKTEMKMASYSHPKGLFTISVPAGWQPTPARDDSEVRFQDPSGKAGAMVRVLSETLYDPAQLGPISRRQCVEFLRTETDARLIKSVDGRLGGLSAVRTDVAYTRSGMPVRGVMLVAIQDGRKVIVSVYAEASGYEGWSPTLEAILESYRPGAR